MVDTDHLTHAELSSRERRQLARPASEIDRPPDRTGSNETEQVEERFRTLGRELRVLLGIPVECAERCGFGHDLYRTCILNGPRA